MRFIFTLAFALCGMLLAHPYLPPDPPARVAAYQDPEPTPAPPLPPVPEPLPTPKDNIEVCRTLVGVGEFQSVDGLILIGKESQPTLANVGRLTLFGDFDTASVLADDSERNPVPCTKINDHDWLIKGEGRVIVVATLATQEPFGIEQRRFDITIPSLQPRPPPEPVDPVDPIEPVDPVDPVDPVEPETPSPFVGEGIRILIVYETDDLPSYPPEVTKTMYGKELRLWAVSNAAKGEGGQPELRIYDKDKIAENEQWKLALRRERGSLPWLIVGNGVKGYEGPLPPTEEATIELLESFK